MGIATVVQFLFKIHIFMHTYSSVFFEGKFGVCFVKRKAQSCILCLLYCRESKIYISFDFVGQLMDVNVITCVMNFFSLMISISLL